jgi:hypothetical protein
MKRWVFPVQADGVSLKVGPLTWSRLPREWKDKFIKGTHRVADLRSKIAAEAKIKSMPPVQVICELWIAEDRITPISGQATILRDHSSNMFGVELPAPTIIIEDEILLRGILVHEFAHCFYTTFQIVKRRKAGIINYREQFDPADGSEDDKRLGNPNEWFGPEDIRNIVSSCDESRLEEPIGNAFIQLYGLLPEVTPSLRSQFTTLSIESDVLEHIESLLLKN